MMSTVLKIYEEVGIAKKKYALFNYVGFLTVLYQIQIISLLDSVRFRVLKKLQDILQFFG